MTNADFLAVVRAQEEATARGDALAIVAPMDPDVVLFDLRPPLAYGGEQARDVEEINSWLATWRDGVNVHLHEPRLFVDGALAVVFGLSLMRGTKTNGTVVESWNRRTLVLKRTAGRWKIVHEHASFPMAMDGSGRAMTDLRP